MATALSVAVRYFETPLGTMVAVAEGSYLRRLKYADRVDDLDAQGEEEQESPVLKMVEDECRQYFAGQLLAFKTPWLLQGTAFQNEVWEVLKTVPYGQTRSYLQMAVSCGHPRACRAVAAAHAANPISLMIPCHRVINSQGGISGYAGGVERKKWLLAHEQQVIASRRCHGKD